jgi:hypothetical protein
MQTLTYALALSALSITLGTAARARADEPAAQPSAAQPAPEPPPAGEKKEEAKAPFVEHGRFGIIGALTEDLWKGGIVYEAQHWEVQVLGHYGVSPKGGDSRDVHIITKAGARIPLGTLNYLALGGDVQFHPGSKEDGVDTGGAYHVGPYISLERYFAATPVMMVLWVNPVQYEHNEESDGSGNVKTTNTFHVAQTGGFGLSYLFF